MNQNSLTKRIEKKLTAKEKIFSPFFKLNCHISFAENVIFKCCKLKEGSVNCVEAHKT